LLAAAAKKLRAKDKATASRTKGGQAKSARSKSAKASTSARGRNDSHLQAIHDEIGPRGVVDATIAFALDARKRSPEQERFCRAWSVYNNAMQRGVLGFTRLSGWTEPKRSFESALKHISVDDVKPVLDKAFVLTKKLERGVPDDPYKRGRLLEGAQSDLTIQSARPVSEETKEGVPRTLVDVRPQA